MNKETKRLSIVIVTYNRPYEVIRAIESCLINIPNNSEIIIWDNGSSEKNREIVQNKCESINFPIKYYYSKENLGPGGGKNAGWKLTTGKYVFIMDDDAIIETEYLLDKFITYMEKNESVGAAYVNIYEPLTNWIYRCELSKKIENQIQAVSFVGGGHIIRKSAFPQENLYPTKFMFGSEELYASLLIWNAGYEIHEVDTLRVLHLPTASNRILDRERDKKILVSSFIVKKMLYPIWLLPVLTIFFRLRIKKNGIRYVECKKLIEENSNNGIHRRISFATLFGLMLKFGFFPLL